MPMKNAKLLWVCCAVVVAFAVFQLIGVRIPAHYDSPRQAMQVGLIHLGRVFTEVLAPFAAVGIIATLKRRHSV